MWRGQLKELKSTIPVLTTLLLSGPAAAPVWRTENGLTHHRSAPVSSSINYYSLSCLHLHVCNTLIISTMFLEFNAPFPAGLIKIPQHASRKFDVLPPNEHCVLVTLGYIGGMDGARWLLTNVVLVT